MRFRRSRRTESWPGRLNAITVGRRTAPGRTPHGRLPKPSGSRWAVPF